MLACIKFIHMVTFLSEELQSSITKYSAKDTITESKFTSFTPKNFIQCYGINDRTYSFLESVSEKAAYFSQVLEIYVLLRNEIELFDKQELKDSDLFSEHGSDLSIRVFDDLLYGSQLNYKEKLAANRINSGRKIYNKLTILMNYSGIDASLKNFISETKSLLQNLPEKSIMDTEYYKEVLPEEDNIFHYYLMDTKKILETLIPEYITANNYFTNNGKALFVLSPEYYLYLAGTSRGKISEIRKFHYFRDDFKNGFMESIIADLKQLNEEIQQNLAFHIYNQNQESKKKIDDFSEINNHELYKIMFEQLKLQSAYKTISSILGTENCDKTFFAFFNLRYLIFFDNKLEFHGALKQNVFYNILKSKIFIFSDYYDVIKAPLDELFKRDIGDFRQDNGEPAKWKMIVDSLIKTVPYKHKFYEREFQ